MSAQMARAADITAFSGLWGTERQCAGEPVKPGGTFVATPIEIDGDWLHQSGIWCRLAWFPVQSRDSGLYGAARAQCGEDSVRGYGLTLVLETQTDAPVLTLFWDEQFQNGPLGRCDE